MDLSKVFDTLNVYILINKLKVYGITCPSLEILDNYLRNSHEFVVFKNINLVLQEFRTEIPQGSNLGPLFFSIYMNDLIKSSNIFNYWMYADDMNMQQDVVNTCRSSYMHIR